MPTNQQKITSIINQAQKNGWMEGKNYVILEGSFAYGGFNVHFINTPTMSFSDIIFDKDFAEKFFPKNCTCHYRGWRTHAEYLLPLTTQERIDFLYQHVEDRWQCGKCINDSVPEHFRTCPKRTTKYCKYCGASVPIEEKHDHQKPSRKIEKLIAIPVDHDEVYGRNKLLKAAIEEQDKKNIEKNAELDKHVEEKEEEYATGDFSCPSNTVITCGKHKEYMHFSDWDLYHAHMKEHAKPKCEPIEELKLRIFEGDFDFTLDKALEDIPLKINELIRHHNERCHGKE